MAVEPREFLIPESLEKLKSLLTPGLSYTDQELHDVAFVFITTPLVAASVLGIASSDAQSLAIVANIIGVPIIADYINLGIIDPVNASKHMDSLERNLASG